MELNWKLLFIDDSIFTKSQIPHKSFRAKNYSNCIPVQIRLFKSCSIVAAISIEKGMENYHVQKMAFNNVSFKKFLLDIRLSNGNRGIICFTDGATFHRC